MPDQFITLRIPEEHLTLAGNALHGLADARIDINAHKSTPEEEFNGNWNFSYLPKQEGESQKEFAQRFVKTIFKAFVKLYDYAEDQDRYRTDVSGITPASEDVPEDVITDIIE